MKDAILQTLGTARTSFVVGFCALLSLTGQAWGSAEEPNDTKNVTRAALHGGVASPTQPLAEAQVYVQEVSRQGFHRILTDEKGTYRFPRLAAGLFRVVVFKEGFVPVVQMLLRKSPDESQELQIELHRESGDIREQESYWAVRADIPPDILRDAYGMGIDSRPAPASTWPTTVATRAEGGEVLRPVIPSTHGIQTRMKADSGIEQLGPNQGDARFSNAEVGIQGKLGEIAIGVRGQFQQLRAGEDSLARTGVPTGRAHSVAVHLSSANSSTFSLTSSGGEMADLRFGGDLAAVNLEHHRLSWNGQTGERGRTSLIASYLQEKGYYSRGGLDPLGTPDASRTLSLEGSYSRDLTPSTSLTTGLRFRQRDGSTLNFANLSTRETSLLEETIGLYGVADTTVRPWVVVEYGLFSQYRDGELSLMPHGGLAVQLGNNWSAKAAASQRFERRASDPRNLLPRGFGSAFYGDDTSCRDVGEACYDVSFSREGKNQERFKVGAVHRQYAETLRLYFNDEFFNRLESLVLVEGDELRELQVQMTRRFSPKILATFRSNLADGGGGIFYATDSKAYKNEVRYLVTSLDTHFQHTDTGVFIAFHHLEQAFNDMKGQTSEELEMQRLQLMLTQDLRVLADMAANWELRVNMEISRGATPYSLTTDNELYKKLTGGLSISF